MEKPIKNSLISPACDEEENEFEVTLRPAK
jgi:hypothetical protein